MLDIAVSKVSLQCPRVVPSVRQSVPAGVPKHVRVGLEAKPCLLPCTLDHAGEACRAERCPSFRGEHERRLGLLFALEAPQGA